MRIPNRKTLGGIAAMGGIALTLTGAGLSNHFKSQSDSLKLRFYERLGQMTNSQSAYPDIEISPSPTGVVSAIIKTGNETYVVLKESAETRELRDISDNFTRANRKADLSTYLAEASLFLTFFGIGAYYSRRRTSAESDR